MKNTKSSVVTFTPRNTMSLMEGLEEQEVAHYAPRLSIEAKFNAALTRRMGMEVTLGNIEATAKRIFMQDAEVNASLGTKSYQAQRVPNYIRFALRDAVKGVAVDAFNSKTKQGGEGLKAKVPEIAALHKALKMSLTRLREAGILFFDTALDLPVWESWVKIGDKPDGSPEFQKDEFWTVDEFAVHMGSTKFAQNLAQWVVAEALSQLPLPTLDFPDSYAGDAFKEAIEASLEGHRERGGQLTLAAYTMGGTLGSFVKEPSLMGALAMVGRVVQQCNKITRKANTQLGKALTATYEGRAGLDVNERQVTILGEYELTIGFDNYNPENGAVVSSSRKLELDLADIQAATLEYVSKWKQIIGDTELAMLGVAYHGGFDVDVQEREDARGTTTTTTFTTKPLVVNEFEPFSDRDTARYYRDLAFAEANKAAMAKAKAFKPKAVRA